MQNLIGWLRGRKTYIIGGLMIAYGATGWAMKWMDPVAAQGFIGGGLTAWGLRAGIAKTETQQ